MRAPALARSLLLWAVLAAAAPAAAQAPDLPASPVLTLDQDRLFGESRFGRQVEARQEAAQQELIAENRALEAQLVEEERRLTERRSVLAPEAFREQAEAFDTRVETLRRAQEAKSRALLARYDAERQRFFEAALPVLAAIVRDSGASVILSDQAIVLSFENIDITDAAIARLDEIFAGEVDGEEGESGNGGTPPTGAWDETGQDGEEPPAE